jgi:hypothetical protein
MKAAHLSSEVSDQNFINEDITGAESSHPYKKIRSSLPVAPLDDQVIWSCRVASYITN